jgi:hypothetical protein
MSSDDICATYARKRVKITVKILDDKDDMVLIEGNADALEFLGNLFLAQARSRDCGFQIAPHSAGQAFFSQHSRLGIYIHRVPCTHIDSRTRRINDSKRKR